MRRTLPLAALTLAAAVAPSASACTIDNCVEVRLAHAASPATHPHGVNADCVVVGRAGVRFSVTGTAVASGHDVARDISLRCTAYVGTTVVFDATVPNTGPTTALTGGFFANPNVRVCATATATWADGHANTVSDCS